MSDIDRDTWVPDGDDIDAMTRDQLATFDPMYAAVAGVLDDWLGAEHGVHSSGHYVGSFLYRLAEAGYRVHRIDPGPSLDELLPPAPD